MPRELDPKREGLLYGRAVAGMLEKVDQVANAIGAAPLSHFYYQDVELYEDAGIEAPEQKEWHDPAEAVPVVSALLDFFRKPDARKLKKAGLEPSVCEHLVWDLQAFQMILEQVVKDKEVFRIEVY